MPHGRKGCKPIPARKVLDAVLWIFNTGAWWHMLPQSYSNYKTIHRRFQHGCRNEVWQEVITDLAYALRDEGAIDEYEAALFDRESLRSNLFNIICVYDNRMVNIVGWIAEAIEIQQYLLA